MAPTAPTPKRDLQWLLAQCVEDIPHARSALLATNDGLRKYEHGFGTDEADRLAAIATGLLSLGRGLGAVIGKDEGAPVRQVVVEHTGCLLFVAQAAEGTVLAVLTEPFADPGHVGHAMGQLVASVSTHLGTPQRADADPRGVSAA